MVIDRTKNFCFCCRCTNPNEAFRTFFPMISTMHQLPTPSFDWFAGGLLPAFRACQPARHHTGRPRPHRYLQLRWKLLFSLDFKPSSVPWQISSQQSRLRSWGLWNLSLKTVYFKGYILSQLKTISIVRWNFLNFLLVGWMVTGEISINDSLPQISLPRWTT